MKYVQSITFRALSALCIGCLLIAFPDKTTAWLVIIIGILFLIPGLISIVAYFNVYTSKESMCPLFPIIGIGSVLFGIILIAFSHIFMDYMKYALAAFLILAGISQLVTLINLRKWTKVNIFFFIMSSLIAFVGLFIIIAAKMIATTVLTILGIASIFYAIVELISAIRFHNVHRIITNKKTQMTEYAESETAEKEETDSVSGE